MSLQQLLGTRVSVRTRQAFEKKALRFGGMSAVLRELIDAFIEDRLTIKPREQKEPLK